MTIFAALDFETSDHTGHSACALGVVRVEEGAIHSRGYWLIRPPNKIIKFSWVHGIRWADVENEPDFKGIWPLVEPMLEGVDFLAAHNAPFDRRVLEASCAYYGIEPPPYSFVCTVQLARKTWELPKAKLPDVCRHLNIPLDHHNALSDAEACAKIVMAAQKEGASLPPGKKSSKQKEKQ